MGPGGGCHLRRHPEQKVLFHRDDVLLDLVGTVYAEDGRSAQERLADPEAELDVRFDPVRTARWMESDAGQWMNQDEIAAACRQLRIMPEQILSTGFQADRFRDRLVAFDAASSVPMGEHDSDFMRSMGGVVRDSWYAVGLSLAPSPSTATASCGGSEGG